MSLATLVKLADLHKIETFIFDDVAPAGSALIAVCGCSAPDSNGEGRMDFAGGTLEDVLDQWANHVLGLHDTESERPTWWPEKWEGPTLAKVAQRMYELELAQILGEDYRRKVEFEKYDWTNISREARLDWIQKAKDHLEMLGIRPGGTS